MTADLALRKCCATRVVVVTSGTDLGGAERSLLTQLDCLPDDVQAVLACPAGRLRQRARELGIESVVVPIGRPVPLRTVTSGSTYSLVAAARRTAGNLHDIWRLVRLTRQLAPDFLHSNSLPTHIPVAVAGVLSGTPTGWHLREIVRPGAGRRVLNRVGHVVDVVIGISEATRRSLDHPRSLVVHNPVGSPPESATALTNDCPGPVVGYLGRLDPRKGLDELVDAVAELDCHLLIAGTESAASQGYEQALRRRTEAFRDRIHLLGQLPEPWALLESVDILVVPSHEEPFGRVAAEGQRAGVAVLAADAAGLREIVTDGRDGLLFSAGDRVALQTALGRLLGDVALRTRIGANGRRSAERFDPSRHASLMAEVYRRYGAHASRCSRTHR